jgi:hypothetical protein
LSWTREKTSAEAGTRMAQMSTTQRRRRRTTSADLKPSRRSSRFAGVPCGPSMDVFSLSAKTLGVVYQIVEQLNHAVIAICASRRQPRTQALSR